MHAWESIQAAVDWIEEHRHEDFGVEELARQASLSPFYFQRLFSRLVGRSAMEYARLRRLAKAAELIEASDAKIVDIAYECGFESHEHFSRSFKEAYGRSPVEHRREPRPLSHFLKPDLSLKYIMVDEGVPLLAEGVIVELRREELGPARYIGRSTQAVFDRGPGVDTLSELWSRFHEERRVEPTLAGLGRELGVSSPGREPGRFTYFAGAEVPAEPPVALAPSELPASLEAWVRPRGMYAICAVEAENFQKLTTEALDKARDYLFGLWLPRHGLQSEAFMIESYGSTEPEASAMELQVKLIEPTS
jgi:Transcriptional regulator containing an amidase domain and an AraC-type DNA-binding HTH domain